jgi:hypothetical protein
MLKGVDKGRATQALRDAMRESLLIEEESSQPIQKSLVDLAHSLDPELASSLVAALDDDPARIQSRIRLKRQIKVLKARKAMLNTDTDAGDIGRAELPSVAWTALGALHAGRAIAQSPEAIRERVAMAAELPFQDAFPVFEWAIANIAIKYGRIATGDRFVRGYFESATFGCELCTYVIGRASVIETRAQGGDGAFGDSIVVGAGDRATGVRFIKEWIERDVNQYLVIADPFFGPEELIVLNWVLELRPKAKVRILTSSRGAGEGDVEEGFRRHWSLISSMEPPDTEINVISVRGKGDSPIHDRWWVTKGSGLRLGTSLNSLGEGKDSDISVLTAPEASEREIEIRRFLDRNVREFKGEKVLYKLFNL